MAAKTNTERQQEFRKKAKIKGRLPYQRYIPKELFDPMDKHLESLKKEEDAEDMN